MIVPFKDKQAFRDFLYNGTEGAVDVDDERLACVEWSKNSAGQFIVNATLLLVFAVNPGNK